MREAIATAAGTVINATWPLALIAFAFLVFVLTPMAFVRSTQPAAGLGMRWVARLLVFEVWLLGAMLTFAAYGWPILIVGLLVLGIGVIPMGIFAAFVTFDATSAGIAMLVILVVALIARFAGAAVIGLGLRTSIE